MNKHMKKALAVLLCSAMLVCPLNASAEVGDHEEVELYFRTAPELIVETDAFQYRYYFEEQTWYDGINSKYYAGEITDETEIWHTKEVRRSFTSDLTDANYIVTGVFTFYEEDAEPVYTILRMNNDYAVPAHISGRWLKPFLGEDQLEIGDLLYVENEGEYNYGFTVMESNPPQLGTSHVTKIENLGSAFDLFGDAFKEVAQNELYLAPNYVVNVDYFHEHLYRLETEKAVELKGDIVDDEEVDVLDIIALNKHLVYMQPMADVRSALAADMNCDTTVDVFDAALLKQEVLSK